MTYYNNSYNNDDDDGIEFLEDNYVYNAEDDYEILDIQDVPRYAPTTDSDVPKKKKKKKRKETTFLKELLSYIYIVIAAVVIAFLITRFVIINAQVPTGSMRDTIYEGDKLIGNRLAYMFSSPKRGDIIIFKYPDNEKENYVKRIIGEPGDVVEIKEGHVFVNGDMLEEGYIREAMVDDGESKIYVVPHDSYFVLGDNRNNSKDSRFWSNTFVNKKQILAKVAFRYYSGKDKKVSFSKVK